MSKAEIPTFLGGDYANLAWEDLSPRELINVTVSSMPRAEYAYEFAVSQASAAAELGDKFAECNYRESARVLGFMSGRTTISGTPHR